jgi:hypothetical protein
MLAYYTAPLDAVISGSLTDDFATFSPCALKSQSSRHLGDALLHPSRVETLKAHAKRQAEYQAQGGIGLAPYYPLASFVKEPLSVYNLLRRELLFATCAAAAAQSHRVGDVAPVSELPPPDARVGMDYDVCPCESPVQMIDPRATTPLIDLPLRAATSSASRSRDLPECDDSF